MYTDHPMAFSKPDDPSTRGLHFLEELNRLWIAEKGISPLCDLQALPAYISRCVWLEILEFGANTNSVVALGKDRVAMNLASQCANANLELASKLKKALKRGQHEYITQDYQRSCSFAFGAVFLIQTYVIIPCPTHHQTQTF